MPIITQQSKQIKRIFIIFNQSIHKLWAQKNRNYLFFNGLRIANQSVNLFS
jgi:hypothetical protein